MTQHIPSETIVALVERALNSPRGIEIPFNTPGAAIHWRQRYYKVRASMTKQDPSTEWRTLSAYIPPEKPTVVQLLPTDSQINMMEVRDL